MAEVTDKRQRLIWDGASRDYFNWKKEYSFLLGIHGLSK